MRVSDSGLLGVSRLVISYASGIRRAAHPLVGAFAAIVVIVVAAASVVVITAVASFRG